MALAGYLRTLIAQSELKFSARLDVVEAIGVDSSDLPLCSSCLRRTLLRHMSSRLAVSTPEITWLRLDFGVVSFSRRCSASLHLSLHRHRPARARSARVCARLASAHEYLIAGQLRDVRFYGFTPPSPPPAGCPVHAHLGIKPSPAWHARSAERPPRGRGEESVDASRGPR